MKNVPLTARVYADLDNERLSRHIVGLSQTDTVAASTAVCRPSATAIISTSIRIAATANTASAQASLSPARFQHGHTNGVVCWMRTFATGRVTNASSRKSSECVGAPCRAICTAFGPPPCSSFLFIPQIERGRLLTPSLCVYPRLLPFYPCGFVRGLRLCMENDYSGYKTSIFQRSTG